MGILVLCRLSVNRIFILIIRCILIVKPDIKSCIKNTCYRADRRMPRSKGRPSCRSLPSPSLRECGAGAAPKSKRRGRSRSSSRSVVAAHLQQESGGAGDREDRPRSDDVQRGTSSKNSQHGKYPTGKGRWGPGPFAEWRGITRFRRG